MPSAPLPNSTALDTGFTPTTCEKGIIGFLLRRELFFRGRNRRTEPVEPLALAVRAVEGRTTSARCSNLRQQRRHAEALPPRGGCVIQPQHGPFADADPSCAVTFS